MAKTLYFNTEPASTHRGHNDAKLNLAASWWFPVVLSELPNTVLVGSGVSSVTGPTNGLETIITALTTLPAEWISEPLSADFTISGTITLNLWASETTMNDNCAINAVIEKVDGATGVITQIAKSARVTEVALSTQAVNNFTVTPTSTACKRGDRLRVRVFADDAGTMAAGGGMQFAFNRASPGGTNGDSWVQFTENLTFEPAGDPTGSTYYLTDTAETINPGAATEKKALKTRGSGSVNAITNTAAGPVAPIQVTATGGGTAIEWYTPPLNAFTLGGKAKFNMRGLESNAAANASLCAQIAVVNGDGTGAVVWAKANIESDNTTGGELGTADAVEIAWVAGDDLAVAAGQRLRFRIYIEDVAIGPLVAGHTVTISYNGASAGAAGDAYVILPVTVTEAATGAVTPISLSAGLTLTPSAASLQKPARTLAATPTLTPAIARVSTDLRTISAGLTATPQISRKLGRTIPVGLTLGSVISSLKTAPRSISGSLVLTPVQTRSAKLFRAIAAALGLTPSQTANFQSGAPAGGNGYGDGTYGDGFYGFEPVATQISIDAILNSGPSLARLLKASRSLDAGLTVAPTLSKSMKAFRAISAGVSLTAAITRRMTYGKSLAAGLSLASALARLKTVRITVPSSLTLSGVLTRLYRGSRTLAASLVATPAVSRDVGLTLNAPLSLMPQASIGRKYARTVPATLTLVPQVTALKGAGKLLAAATTLTPAVSRVYRSPKVISTTVVLTPTLSRDVGKSLSAGLTLSPALVRSAKTARALSFTLALSPLISRQATHAQQLGANLPLDVQISILTGKKYALAATLLLDPAQKRKLARSLQAVLSLSAGFTLPVTHSRAISASTGLSAALTTRYTLARSFQIGLTVVPALSKRTHRRRTVSSTLNLTPIIFIFVSEGVVLTQSLLSAHETALLLKVYSGDAILRRAGVGDGASVSAMEGEPILRSVGGVIPQLRKAT